jgi:hypothetical protein
MMMKISRIMSRMNKQTKEMAKINYVKIEIHIKGDGNPTP